MKHLLLFTSLLICVSFATNASAHTRSQSFSHWSYLEQSVSFEFVVDARRVTQLAPLYNPTNSLASLLEQHVLETVFVIQNHKTCAVEKIHSYGAGRSSLRVSGVFRCPQSTAKNPTTASITAFQIVSPTHLHIARIDSGGSLFETVVREGRSSFSLQPEKPASDLQGFITAGFLHVLSGLDHLVFLLALVMIAKTVRMAIYCVTGFTVGHSLTLAMATLGWLEPDEKLIEAIIGFTIALTALEAGIQNGLDRHRAMIAFATLTLGVVLLPVVIHGSVIAIGIPLAVYLLATAHLTNAQASRQLPVITIIFGLVHGVGFAGGLKEAALFQSQVFVPILGFNAGVELAQLVALTAFFGLPLMLKRFYSSNLFQLRIITSALIFGTGCFWFAQRLWV